MRSPRVTKPLRVLQTHVVLRHGDRTPTYNCMEPMGERAVIESFAWARKLPRRAELATLHSEFDVVRPDGAPPRDRDLGVFGSLTRRGLAQTRALGRSLRGVYGAVDRADCVVYSSNFTRTVRSAQSMLGGFLDLATARAEDAEAAEAAAPLRINVTSDANDHINVYAHVPGLARRMAAIVNDPEHHSGVHAAEQAMAPLTRALESAIPCYAMFIKSFSWIGAADHFYCREMRRDAVAGGYRDAHAAVDAEDDGVTNAHVEALFHEIDNDADGAISLEELRGVLDVVCARRVSDGDALRVYRSMLGEDGEAAGAGASRGDALPPLRLSHFAAFVRRGLPAIPADDLARVAAAASAAGDAVASLGDRMDPRRHAGATPPGMDAIVGVAMSHLCRRFHAWYCDDETLRLAVGRMMRLVTHSFEARIAASAGAGAGCVGGKYGHAAPFIVHSGHDVSVAPVLASLSARGWDPYAGDVWPGYASAVRLELVCDDGEAEGVGAREGEATVTRAGRGQLDVDAAQVSFLLFTVTFYANHANNLTRSP